MILNKGTMEAEVSVSAVNCLLCPAMKLKTCK